MAEVRPLRGIRYAPVLRQDSAQLITPPFDVISPQAQTAYYERHPYNIIRLELGKGQPNDNSLNNVYTRAAATYAEWRKNSILQQEAASVYYLYQQRFNHGGQTFTRTSLIARVRLEPWEKHVVLRHEHTRTKDKADRLNLLRACATNFSPIMVMYDDPQGRIRRMLSPYGEQAELHCTDDAGEEQRLHPITDPQQIALIQDFFAQRQLYIADGHHRYETALAYRQEILEQRHELHPEDATNFVLMALIDLDDPGLFMLPTHRLLFGLEQETLEKLSAQRLTRYFTVQTITASAASEIEQYLARAGQQESVIIIGTAQQTLLLILNEQGKAHMQNSGHSAAWNELDVAIAHQLILDELLGLGAAAMAAGAHVRSSQDAAEALQAVQSGEAQAALLLNTTRVRQVCAVAEADDQMPQKSTYFYPKLTTGLVLNPLW